MWLWMQHLDEALKGATLHMAYTFRKARLDLHFSKDQQDIQLSWEKQGNQALLTSTENPSLPRRRVAVLKHIHEGEQVQAIQLHSKDRLLKLRFESGYELIIGLYPAALNVYLMKDRACIDSFLKQSDVSIVDHGWLSASDPLPESIPGPTLSPEQLLAAKRGISVDWDTSTINFAPETTAELLSIRELVIESFRHGKKPKQAVGQLLQKTARTVLKRWKSKASKIEAELKEALTWQTLELKLQALQIGLGMGVNLKTTGGVLDISAELSPNRGQLTYELDPLTPLPQHIENTAKKIRKYRSKLDQLDGVLKRVQSDIVELEGIVETKDDNKLQSFLQEHGEALDKSGKQQVERKPYKQYKSPSNFDILVGRTSTDNDTLTFKVASKHDWWFHARQVRGSHVILRTGTQTPDHADIVAAAEHAALNSKAKHSGLVVVQYCQRKHLSKPKGSNPGTVLVHQEQSITISLD